MSNSVIPLKRLALLNCETLGDQTDAEMKFRYIDIASTGRGALLREPEEMTFASSPSRARRVVQPGDTILSTVRTYLRAVWTLRDVCDDLVASTGFVVLRPRANMDPRFLGWLAQADTVVEEVVARSVGVSYPAINPSAVGEIKVPCPPLNGQRAIADYLDRETARIDALIAAKRRMVELLKERFVRFVQSVVDPDEPSASGHLVPLKYLTRIERGVFSHRPRNDPAFYDGPHPFIQTGDVARARKYVDSWTQTLNDRGLAVSRKFPAGTLTMVIAANIGDVGITTFDACFPDSVVGIQAKASVLDGNYLYFGLLAAKRRLVEMAPVTTQANLNVERIGTLVVRCPSLEEQRSIANGLDTELKRSDRVADREERSVTLLQERRQALITAAVTGQLAIPEAA